MMSSEETTPIPTASYKGAIDREDTIPNNPSETEANRLHILSNIKEGAS